MAGIRELLAAVLGVGLGIIFLVAPGFIIKIHTLGRGPQDRHGDFGSHAVDSKWQWVVRAFGLGLVAAGAYFAYTALLA